MSRALAAAAIGLAAALLTSACGGGAADSVATSVTVEPPEEDWFELGPLRVDGTALVDSEGREVLLHGAAINSLGDYYQADPRLDTVNPVTAAELDLMAANGFSVVRLVVSWSSIEPEPGRYDADYLGRVRDLIEKLADRDMYTIVDMHQDAWGKFIATPEGVTCPDGSEPAIGWDGAPEWATITDGQSTCRLPGFREGSPAVVRAFRNFYGNRDGIRDAFVAMWGHVATTLADVRGLAGFDLLNEPYMVLDAADMPAAYTELLALTIGAVRSAEVAQGAPPHPIFVEPVVLHPLPGNLPDFEELDDDADLVFSPHVYPTALTRAQFLEIFDANATTFDMPLWIGEFHFTGRDDANVADAVDFAHRLDAVGASWSWWLWSVGCGDPHAMERPRVPPGEPLVERTDLALMAVDCPEGRVRPNEALLPIAGRSYPRVTPGRISELRSDIETGGLDMAAEAARVGSTLLVWLNGNGGREFRVVESDGLAEIEMREVPGGTLLRAVASDGSYSLHVES